MDNAHTDNSTAPSTPGTKKVGGAGAVAAGSAAIGGILSGLLSQINLDREIAIAISNFTDKKLSNPEYYIESGKLEDIALEVKGGEADFITGSKTNGTATGTVAVLTYEIEGTSDRFAVLWSVPFDYNLYVNRLYFKIIDGSKKVDSDLYNEMYEASAKADDGTLKIKDKGYKVKGVMGTGGQAALNISFKLDS